MTPGEGTDLSFISHFGSESVIVFYDPKKLYRAAENEYHFCGVDPRGGVIGLIIDYRLDLDIITKLDQ